MPKRDLVDSDSVRPIRLWIPKESRQMQYYYFLDAKRACERALLLVAWHAVEESIEVFHGHTGRLLATFTQRVNGKIDYEIFDAGAREP